MSRPIIKIHNIETGEIIEREYNDVELAQWEKEQAEEMTRQAAKAQAKIKREALLERLGITEEEARLLLQNNP